MTLFELVDNLCRSDIAAPHHRYVALARVLERATEEHMVELDKLFAKYKIDLSNLIIGGVSGVFLYISCFGKIEITSGARYPF
jgi:hypothetical protein